MSYFFLDFKRVFNFLFVVAFSSILFGASLTVEGGIEKDRDDFEDLSIITSSTDHANFDVRFNKILYGGKLEYGITFNSNSARDFKDAPLRIKFDKEKTIYEAINLKVEKVIFSSSLFGITNEVIKKINTVDSITIRIEHRYGSPTTWMVPEKTLKEWKEVINMKF